MEKFKDQQKSVTRNLRKQTWERTIPSLRNLGLGYQHDLQDSCIVLDVTNLLDVNETSKTTRIVNLKDNDTIEKIQCPDCKQPIKLNKHWNAFLCRCDNIKKVYEVKGAKISYGLQQKEKTD